MDEENEDFGDFEETHRNVLDFNQGLFKRILDCDAIYKDSDIQEEDTTSNDKMILLTSLSENTLKRYNILTGNDRGYKYSEGGMNLATTHAQMAKLSSIKLSIDVVNEWMIQEDRLNVNTNTNVFQWWSNKQEDGDEIDNKINSKRLIPLGDVLLNSANKSAIRLKTERELEERNKRALELEREKERKLQSSQIIIQGESEQGSTNKDKQEKSKSNKWSIIGWGKQKNKSKISKDFIGSNSIKDLQTGNTLEENNSPRLAFGDALDSKVKLNNFSNSSEEGSVAESEEEEEDLEYSKIPESEQLEQSEQVNAFNLIDL